MSELETDALEGFPEQLNGIPVPYGDPVAELRTRIGAPGPRAWAAFLALAADPSEEAFEALDKACEARDPYLRKAALEALGRHHEAPRAAERVVERLDDADERVARAALAVGATLQLVAAHARALEWLAGDEDARRLAAVGALGSLWREEDFEPALAALLREPEAKVRRELALLLQARARGEQLGTLFELFVSDRDAHHRAWACRLAESALVPEWSERVRALRDDLDGHVRKAAAAALRAFERGQATRTLKPNRRRWRWSRWRAVLASVGAGLAVALILGTNREERLTVAFAGFLLGGIAVVVGDRRKEWLVLSPDGIEGPSRFRDRLFIARDEIDVERTLERGLRASPWHLQRIHARRGASIHFDRSVYGEPELALLVRCLEAFEKRQEPA